MRSQQKEVYAWLDAIGHGAYADVYCTPERCSELIAYIAEVYDISCPVYIRKNYTRIDSLGFYRIHAAFHHTLYEVWIAEPFLSDYTVAHEMAHCVTNIKNSHSPVWVRTYLNILKSLGYDTCLWESIAKEKQIAIAKKGKIEK